MEDITKSRAEESEELIITVVWNSITQNLNCYNMNNIFIDKFLNIYDKTFLYKKLQWKGKI